MKLIICGNGFDLHHNMYTSYCCYKKFLIEEYSEVYEKYEEFPYLSFDKDQWNDIERALSIDYHQFMEDAMDDRLDPMEDSDRRNHIMQQNAEMATSFIKDFTGKCFAQWLSKVKTSHVKPKIALNISSDDLYVNFNYTDTLQKVYSVPDKNILHIHGKLDKVKCKKNSESVRKEIQFGAADLDEVKAKKELKKIYGKDEFYGIVIEPTINALCGFIAKASKNLNKNYNKLKKFIENKEITEIKIMGHSLNGADLAYYKDIFVPKYKELQWTFMNHNDSENIRKFISRYELQNKSIVNW